MAEQNQGLSPFLQPNQVPAEQPKPAPAPQPTFAQQVASVAQQYQQPQQPVAPTPVVTAPTFVPSAPAPRATAPKPTAKKEHEEKVTIKYHVQTSYWTDRSYDYAEFYAASEDEFKAAIKEIHANSNELKRVLDLTPYPFPTDKRFPTTNRPVGVPQPIPSPIAVQPQPQPVQQVQPAPVAQAPAQNFPGLVTPGVQQPQPQFAPQPQRPAPQGGQGTFNQYVPGVSGIFDNPQYNLECKWPPKKPEHWQDLARLGVLQNGAPPWNWKKVLGIPPGQYPANGGGGNRGNYNNNQPQSNQQYSQQQGFGNNQNQGQ